MSDLIRLGDHTIKIGSGQTPSGGYRSYVPTGIPLIRSQNVQMGEFTHEGLVHITNSVDESMAGSRVFPGDVLLNITGASIGRVCVVPDDICPANVNQHVCIIRCDESLSSAYVATLLASPMFQALIWDSQAGGTRQALTKQMIENFGIPLRDIEEQRQIATRLKAQLAEVETARLAIEAQARDAAVLKSKALETLFSGIENWAPIGSAAKLQSGYAFKSDTFQSAGVRLLRNANILPGRVYWDDAVYLSQDDSKKHPSYVLKDGDVLISLDRPIISSGIKVARVRSNDLPALLVQRVGRFLIDPDKLDADYLYACLQTDVFISEISGHDQSVGVPHISPSQVESVEIPLPDVSVQRELSTRMNEVSFLWQKAVAAIHVQRNDLSRLSKAILAEAFNQ
jgi:type I restriction enzyme S subunit